MTLKAIMHYVSKHLSFGAHHKRPILAAAKMYRSAVTVVSGNIRFRRIFVEVPWRQGVKRLG